MKYGGRPRSMEDNDGPGFDYNSHNLKSGAIWMVSPSPRGDLSALESATGGSKKHLKSTFGTSQRFKDGRGHGSATPSGNMYYAHSRLLNGEDYLTGGGATSLGFGTKVDFSNPLRHSPANKNHVSPASYSPVLIGGATSALDGFTVRATTSPAMVSRGATRPASPASPAAKRRADIGEGGGDAAGRSGPGASLFSFLGPLCGRPGLVTWPRLAQGLRRPGPGRPRLPSLAARCRGAGGSGEGMGKRFWDWGAAAMAIWPDERRAALSLVAQAGQPFHQRCAWDQGERPVGADLLMGGVGGLAFPGGTGA
ncbi:unnamed protein product [Prorocentrum cordatum]|uniref:Uncharacterized protein n=1 Tax=Prorocentrum cordatum TaxID=2364126 RepID=A0ABN9UWM0_9DINO|nr:unnamed protein product [Polarella glacialis]